MSPSATITITDTGAGGVDFRIDFDPPVSDPDAEPEFSSHTVALWMFERFLEANDLAAADRH